MKKILVLFVLLFSVSVFAQESNLHLNGYYMTQYNNWQNFSRTKDPVHRDSFLSHLLRLNGEYKVSNDIQLKGRIHFLDGKFGNDNNNEPNTDLRVNVQYFYADLNTGYGNAQVGRLSGHDVYGLSNLGYELGWGEFVYGGVFEDDNSIDGIGYTGQWGDFAVKALYGKIAHQGWDGDSTVDYNNIDTDVFAVEPSYKWDENGGVSVALKHKKQYSSNNPAKPNFKKSFDQYSVNPAIMAGIAGFSAHVEGFYTQTTYKDNNNARSVGYDSGVYGDIDFNYGMGNVTLAGWFMSGRDEDKGFNYASSDSQGNFFPFVVAYTNDIAEHRHQAVALFVNHEIMKGISAHLSGAYFTTTDSHVNGTKVKYKELGYEVDFGVLAEFNKHFSFESVFGYYQNGNYYRAENNRSAVTFAWMNALKVHF